MRASFLRFLLLGGDEQAPVHEQGVKLLGGLIEGSLNLGSCRIPRNVDLKRCRFTHLLFAQDARIDGLLTLQGSSLARGLNADRLHSAGGVHLRRGFKAEAEVRLLGAQIDGVLDCEGGQFEAKAGRAFSADRVVVKGSAFFRNGFSAIGRVKLEGAQIGGALSCRNGKFAGADGEALSIGAAVVKGGAFFTEGFKATGAVRLVGAHIGGSLDLAGGQFDVDKGEALVADRIVVRGSVFFRDAFKATGQVRLVGAQIDGDLVCRGGQFEAKGGHALSTDNAIVRGAWFFDTPKQAVSVSAGHMQVGVLVDAIDSWREGSSFDGLRYDALGGKAPTSGSARRAWLLKQRADHCKDDFRPQPWRHLQRVLREMGHAEDARQIAIAFEKQMRAAGRIGQSPPDTWWVVAGIKRLFARVGHWLFGMLSGYGYRPMRLLAWMFGVWLVFAGLLGWLALPPHNAIGPSDPLVFQHPQYAHCVPGSPAAAVAAASGVENAGNWYLCDPLPADYSTFSPLAYSLDIILPLVDLGQEKFWGPRVMTPKAGVWDEWTEVGAAHVVRWLVWFETLFGWVAGLLLVSIVSGLARRSED